METSHELRGSWKKLKGLMKRKWAQLTGNNLDRAEGNLNEIAGDIEKKYGKAKDKTWTKVEKVKHRLMDKKGSI